MNNVFTVKVKRSPLVTRKTFIKFASHLVEGGLKTDKSIQRIYLENGKDLV